MFKNTKLALGIITVSVFLLMGGGCQTAKKDLPTATTGLVKVVIEKVVLDQKTGVITLQSERIDEVAERSTSDKGSEALLTPQRIASTGIFYLDSYSIGPKNEIITSIYNQKDNMGSDLWVFSNGKIRLTKSTYSNRTPSFSKYGKNVYFVSSKGHRKKARSQYDQTAYIWRMSSNGAGGLTRIGTPAYQFFDPKESPDGKKILFSSKEFYGNSPFIWYMQKNGALPTQLKQGIHASWIDDNTIMFSAQDENTGLYSIWTVKINGANLTQIIFDNEMDCIYPSIDPTGQFIAYVKQVSHKDTTEKTQSEKTQSRDIHVYHIKDGLSQQLTTNISRDDMPRWSHSGDHLYFRSTRGLAWSIWRLSTDFLK